MILLLVSTIILEVFINTEPRILLSCTIRLYPLALPKMVTHCFQALFNRRNELVLDTANASQYHLELVLCKVITSI